MNPTTPYRPPRTWLHVGKYLLPVGMTSSGWRRTKSPREQVSVVKLAAEYPESVLLHTPGTSEALPELQFECYAAGQREVRALPPLFVPPGYVAELHQGMSFGRSCCVIGPGGEAVRETGFSLDGQVLISKQPLSRLRPRYWRKRWEGDVTSRPWLPPKQRIDGRVAVLNARCSHNFFHWLIDILPRLTPLRRAGLEADYYLVDCLSPFQQDVLAALGIERRQLIQPHCRLLLEAENLLVPSAPTPSCLRDLSRMLLAGLGAGGHVRSPRRIFISRQKSRTRTLANERELQAMLRAHDFEIHSMEDYRLAKQARLIREAEIIVSTHGAGLANLLFARPGTRIIEIVPAGRFNWTCYPKRSRIFGLHHQLVFAECARRKQILQVALEDIAAALSRAERLPLRIAAA